MTTMTRDGLEKTTNNRNRTRFEKMMAKDANEVVLVDEEGRFFEGLSSNFFVENDLGPTSADSHRMDGRTNERRFRFFFPTHVWTSSSSWCLAGQLETAP